MHENSKYVDPMTRRVYWFTTWRPGPAPVVPTYTDKFAASRPLQQRARDGIMAKHRRRPRKEAPSNLH